MELLQELTNNFKISDIGKEQGQFMNNMMNSVMNTALDIGLRALLPDLIEQQVIDIKNSLFNEGLQEGINTAINSLKDFAKSALGIVTGDFENISQVQNAVEKGGIIDTISNIIDFALDKAQDKGLIDKNTAGLIDKGKDVILDNISQNIEGTLTEQIKGIEKLDKYSENWNNYYNEKDFEGMEKEYTKIKKQLKELIPLEETLKNAREIENLHTLIKNNNGDFNLSQNELDLAKILV